MLARERHNVAPSQSGVVQNLKHEAFTHLSVAIVGAVLVVLALSNVHRRALTVTLWASLILMLAGCGAETAEQAQVVSVTPTSLPTTAPLSVPTPAPAAAPTSTALPQVTSTAVPAQLPTPTVAPATPMPDPAPSPTTASEVAPAPTDVVPATSTAEPVETPTPVPTPTAGEPETNTDSSSGDSGSAVDSTPTPVAATPTAVAASGEPPLECFDKDVQVYRAHVEGVDALSFEGGRVYCSGAGTNAVSAAGSYRHSSGLVVQRNANYIFNNAGTGYIPYSGSVHFCMNGQPASAPVRADSVPALLVVIDGEAQRQLAQGASSPAAFTGSSAQC